MFATRLVGAVAFVLVLCCAAANPTWAGAKWTWKYATLAPDGPGWARQIKKIYLPVMDRITNGDLENKIYWGGVMGDDEDYIRKMHIGQLQGAGLSGQGVTLAVPELAVLELPFLFSDFDEVDYLRRVMRPTVDELGREHGYHIISWVDQDFDQIYSTRFPMTEPGHFAKSRFLTWYGPLEQELLQSLGANPIPVNVPEVSASMRQGVVDAAIAPGIWMVGSQMYAVVKYINPMKIRYSPVLILVTQKAWTELPADYRERITAARADVEQDFCEAVREDNAKCLKAMVDYGVTWVELDPEQKRTLREKAVSTWDQMAGRLYSQGLLNEVLNHLAEYRAWQNATDNPETKPLESAP